MESREELINIIVQTEWEMFQDVNKGGGARSSCQEDPKTFEVMRSSQFAAWSDKMLESYMADLEDAKVSSRNLLTEKYARMMESTSPLEYAKIKDRLPVLDPENSLLIDKILKIELLWEEELLKKFPNIMKNGRPIFSSDDTLFSTSKETYFKGELATYSKKTLEYYYEEILEKKSKNINMSAIVLEAQVKRYGYPSMEKAEMIISNM